MNHLALDGKISTRWRRQPTHFGLILAFLCGHSLAAEDLAVLKPSPDGTPPARQLEKWLMAGVNQMVAARNASFEKAIKSRAACEAWQRERRAFFLDRIGGLPERTPLNPQITGTLAGKGYRLEKILLETRPGFHLTANLYLPDTPPPWPAVLVPCGHSHDGKAAGAYQLVCRLLARHGMAALCYDPIGQGERYQLLDTANEHTAFEDSPRYTPPHPAVRLTCTTEHTMTGFGSALLGANVAQFRIWDGMRVIDYLQSRPDILRDKIGCTGNSGGGTETAYLMALDDRILAAAPGCYLTTFAKLIETRGPQDGEQIIFGQLAFGMDQADYCIMRAPRPTLICAGTRDATFDFGGTWELFRDAKRFASRIGHADSVDLAAADAPHGFTLQLREAATRFMARHLLGRDILVREVETLPDSFTDDELRAFSQPDWTAAQLQCTPQGQVLLLPGERSVFQINAGVAAQWKAQREPVWKAMNDAGKQRTIRETIGATFDDNERVEVRAAGSIERDGFVIQKLILTTEPSLDLPALAFVPKAKAGPRAAVLYLHGGSMKADAAPGGPIEALVKQGRIVLAAELRGIGETEVGPHSGRTAYGRGRFGPDLLDVMTAYLMGRSHVGMRCDDALRWLRHLQSGALTGGAPAGIELIATGEATIPALHAAALRPAAFRRITMRRMIPSWESLVGAGETFDQAVNIVHGALRHYDLPDLARFIAAEKITFAEPVDGLGRAVP